MPFYKKKPVVIEARIFDHEAADELIAIEAWCGGYVSGSKTNYPCLYISTLEGEMQADVGDYIIKGVKGEFYPCKPDIFRMTYEEVNP